MATKKTFEKLLLEATEIVEKLEKGDLSLNESMQSYKNGYAILTQCQELLQNAESEYLEIMEKMQIKEDGDL
jgi:Exonuclease VII small subunit